MNRNTMNNSCGCGCGRTTNIFRGVPRKFINGHNGRGKCKDILISGDGYELKLVPDHHFANCYGRVRNHRLVYEEYHKCCLLPWAEIHHIDKNKLNNNIDNLIILNTSDHCRLHNIKDMSNRKCSECGSDKTQWDKRGWFEWFDDKDEGWYCRRCYKRLKYHNKI